MVGTPAINRDKKIGYCPVHNITIPKIHSKNRSCGTGALKEEMECCLLSVLQGNGAIKWPETPAGTPRLQYGQFIEVECFTVFCVAQFFVLQWVPVNPPGTPRNRFQQTGTNQMTKCCFFKVLVDGDFFVTK